jgi:hypothetical protein
MIRLSLPLVIVITLVALVPQATAGNFAVGTCKPKLKSYSTISLAVSSVPPGSHISVCPGSYPEQVSITQPLTMEGTSSANSGRAIITVPGEAQGNPQLQINSSSCLIQCGAVAAQLVVQNVNPPGPVIVSNITVDGTGGQAGDCLNGGAAVVGIFYASGSSGTILRSTTRHHTSDGCAVGIAVESQSVAGQAVTVRDNSVHDADMGILTGATAGPSQILTTTISGNFLSKAGYGGFGAAIFVFNTATVESNFVTANDGGAGIYANPVLDEPNSILVFSNTLADDSIGLVLNGDGVVGKSNAISHSTLGITFTAAANGNNGATAQSNTIMNADKAIEPFCNISSGITLTANDINDARIGLDHISSTYSVHRTRFDNVDTIETTCN